MRLVFGIVIALAMSWAVWSRSETKDGSGSHESSTRYQPYVAGYILPLYFAGFYLLSMITLGRDSTNHTMLSMCFSVFLQITIYYAILLPLLPFLRRRISARACAMLWIIPNYLYLLEREALTPSAPLLVITAPGNLAWVLSMIWLTGFVGVWVWKIAGHIRFRRQILNGAEDCPLAYQQKWKLALTQAKMKDTDFSLLVSPHVKTPVTVGLFRRSTVVVLPRKAYMEEELDLIFQHEIVHIGRMDAWNKFFSVFCTAMCWFNPLMWLAMGKTAEDLELSCDETVLMGADEATRKLYAGLLLNTAGDGRGFTTCLSASAQALRHRLKSVVKPPEKSTGAIVVGVAFCLLAATGGFVALAYDNAPASEILLHSEEPSAYVLTVRNADHVSSEDALDLADTEQILHYLSGLSMYRITGLYDFSTSSREALFQLHFPGVSTDWIYVYDNAIEVYHLGEEPLRSIMYYIPGGIDWDRLDSWIPTA